VHLGQSVRRPGPAGVDAAARVRLLARRDREVLLEEVRVEGIRMEERTLAPEDLERADEVFITSTTRGLLPVLSIEGRPMRQSGETLVRLQEAFRRYVDDYVARERGIPLTAGGSTREAACRLPVQDVEAGTCATRGCITSGSVAGAGSEFARCVAGIAAYASSTAPGVSRIGGSPAAPAAGTDLALWSEHGAHLSLFAEVCLKMGAKPFRCEYCRTTSSASASGTRSSRSSAGPSCARPPGMRKPPERGWHAVGLEY